MSSKESMDIINGSRRRRGSGPKAGSVWESRMKLDEVKGGIKVFIAPPDQEIQETPKQSPIIGASGKRKTWKSESPVQILGKNSDEVSKELNVSVDGIKKSPNSSIKKTRSVSSQRKLKSDSCNSEENNKAAAARSDEQFSECEDKGITSKDEDDDEIKVEKKSFDVKEDKIGTNEIISSQKSTPISPIVKKQSPCTVVNYATSHSNSPKTRSNNFHGIPRTNGKLQSIVDLIMWRDVSKSAFVFGIGIFAIISSSYTKDLNISFISVVSYLGLVYLAGNFLFRSIISRVSMERDNDEDYVVGEEEAIWAVKLILPYINEFLLKLRALFSGDPATTMKLAVLLFILARCGTSITIWKMAKLGFIGVFTVPKICSAYSSQLIAYGTFWIRRFGDGWESCSHKKAVGFAIFTLFWNLSSVVARIWAVFILSVAFKYYQQSSMKEGWKCDEIATTQNSAEKFREQTLRPSTLIELRKQKKVC